MLDALFVFDPGVPSSAGAPGSSYDRDRLHHLGVLSSPSTLFKFQPRISHEGKAFPFLPGQVLHSVPVPTSSGRDSTSARSSDLNATDTTEKNIRSPGLSKRQTRPLGGSVEGG